MTKIEQKQDELIKLKDELIICYKNINAGYTAYQADIQIREKGIKQLESELAQLKAEAEKEKCQHKNWIKEHNYKKCIDCGFCFKDAEEWFDNHSDCYASEATDQVCPAMTKGVFLKYASQKHC